MLSAVISLFPCSIIKLWTCLSLNMTLYSPNGDSIEQGASYSVVLMVQEIKNVEDFGLVFVTGF